MKIQRKIENQFLNFIAKKKTDGYKTATQQVIFSAIRSFFEAHYFPLRLRKGDYPKGASNGVKRATKEAILAILNQNTRHQTTVTALVMTLKDSGLRVSDIKNLNCNIILEALKKNPNTDLIQLNIITEKTKLLAKTFLGQEAIQAIKTYIELRQKGTTDIKPEIVTNESPLFRTWQHKEAKRLQRTSISNLIRNAFIRANEKRMSPHSLRKKLQTDLEKANVNTNWIDQILGHELINSRDAYSLPTDEELKEAYLRAYQHIRVLPELNTTSTETPPQSKPMTQITETEQEEQAILEIKANDINAIKQALLKGYKHADTVENIRLYMKN